MSTLVNQGPRNKGPDTFQSSPSKNAISDHGESPIRGDYNDPDHIGQNAAPTQYDKEAISRFRKMDYVRGLNGHCDVASANTLQHSIKQAINLDGMFDRFGRDHKGNYELKGGHFSETYWNETTLGKKVSNKTTFIDKHFVFLFI